MPGLLGRVSCQVKVGSELLPFSPGAQLMPERRLCVNLTVHLRPDPKWGQLSIDTALEIHTKDKEQREGF